MEGCAYTNDPNISLWNEDLLPNVTAHMLIAEVQYQITSLCFSTSSIAMPVRSKVCSQKNG